MPKNFLDNIVALIKSKWKLVTPAFAIFLILLIYLVSKTLEDNSSTAPKKFPIPTKTQEEQLFTSPSLPDVTFGSYVNGTSLPTVPPSINVYKFKTNYSTPEILTFAQKFGLNQTKDNQKNSIIVYNVQDPEKAGVLVFNKNTGMYSYQSLLGLKLPPIPNLSKNQLVQTYLSNLGVIDSTVDCSITYQKKDIPNTTYVECHRNWVSAGLPILNFYGVLNIPQDKSLSSLNLGSVYSSLSTDPQIYNSSTQEDGLKRPDDFNTLTVGLRDDQSIVSINSNLRKIESQNTLTATNLLTPQDALSDFSGGMARESLVIPAGSGTLDFAKLFPYGKASSPKANIYDFVLVYAEKPPTLTQNYLEPMYLIKGQAILDSGYVVRFSQMVPALKNPLASGEVAGESTIKLGNFNPYGETPTQPPLPTQNPSHPPSPNTTTAPVNNPPPNLDCHPSETDLNPIYSLSGNLGKIGLTSDNLPNGAYSVYFIPPPSDPLPSLESVLDALDALIPSIPQKTQYIPAAHSQNKANIAPKWHNLSCPLKMDSSSPSIFVYAPPNTSLNLSIDTNLIYKDPPQNLLGGWNIKTLKNGRLNIDGYNRDFIYYEYKTISFEKPQNGWIIKKEQLEDFVRNSLSADLKLLPEEKYRLIFEIKSASFYIDSPYIFIGLIDKDELNRKLPLNITPSAFAVNRYHFYISPISSPLPLTPPKLSPVTRNPYMILELGSYRGN